MVHIKLSTIKRQLQERMHYPLTREEAGKGYNTLDEAFDTLLYGFFRHTCKSVASAGAQKLETLKRGWMTEKQADLFADYCIKGWRII